MMVRAERTRAKVLLTFLRVLVVHVDARVIKSRDVYVGGLLVCSFILTLSLNRLVRLSCLTWAIIATII